MQTTAIKETSALYKQSHSLPLTIRFRGAIKTEKQSEAMKAEMYLRSKRQMDVDVHREMQRVLSERAETDIIKLVNLTQVRPVLIKKSASRETKYRDMCLIASVNSERIGGG